jgi:hypothetical protein
MDYQDNPTMSSIIGFISNPGSITNKSLTDSMLDANYRSALRKSRISIEDGILIYCEQLAGSESYAHLQLVPTHFWNIICVAFHSNPVRGHFNPYCTFYCMRLCFYWPGMYTHVTQMCKLCPGCALSNPTRTKSSELVYNFPIETLMMILHIDGYQAGNQQGFEGSNIYLIACCGMCSFAAMELISNPSAATYALAIMTIILRYSFSTRTVNSLTSAATLWICYALTAISSLVTTITKLLSNASIGT